MNKRIAVLSWAVASLSIAVAAAASTVKYDFDREVDFSKWAYVAWRTDERPDASMVDKRIGKAVEAGFEARGYVLTQDRTKADFVIDYRVAAWQDVSLEGNLAGPALGPRYARVNRESMGALVIHVYDGQTGKLAWHGVVSGALASNPEQADKRTAKVVEKLLRKFPARGGGE